MSNKAARMAATPTALVAALGGGGGRSRRVSVPGMSVPKPLAGIRSARRRRRRKHQILRVAHSAGAVVSAVAFAAELAGTLRDLAGDGSAPAPAMKPAAKRTASKATRAKATAARKTPAKKTASNATPANSTPAKKPAARKPAAKKPSAKKPAPATVSANGQ